MMIEDDEYNEDEDYTGTDTIGMWDDEPSDDESDDFDSLAIAAPPKKLVGHTNIVTHLEALASGGKMPHALLFSGTRGIGKAKVAEAFARMLLTGKHSLDVPDTHSIVTQMHAGSCGDYLFISGENRGDESREKAVLIDIDQIRAIDHFLSLTRSSCPMRVVVIDGAEAMNANAANALLKNLEEPPPHTVIILISHNAAKLLPTIRSRCRLVGFKPLTHEECQEILAINAPGSAAEDLERIAALADASPGLALKWLNLNGVSMYQHVCELFASESSDAAQIAEIRDFAASIAADKAIIHQNFQMLTGLLLAFFSRMHQSAPLTTNEAETLAMQRWKSTTSPEQWTECWFEIKDQCNMAQGLHLDTKNILTTLLLRLVRGKMPLSLKAS